MAAIAHPQFDAYILATKRETNIDSRRIRIGLFNGPRVDLLYGRHGVQLSRAYKTHRSGGVMFAWPPKVYITRKVNVEDEMLHERLITIQDED